MLKLTRTAAQPAFGIYQRQEKEEQIEANAQAARYKPEAAPAAPAICLPVDIKMCWHGFGKGSIHRAEIQERSQADQQVEQFLFVIDFHLKIFIVFKGQMERTGWHHSCSVCCCRHVRVHNKRFLRLLYVLQCNHVFQYSGDIIRLPGSYQQPPAIFHDQLQPFVAGNIQRPVLTQAP